MTSRSLYRRRVENEKGLNTKASRLEAQWNQTRQRARWVGVLAIVLTLVIIGRLVQVQLFWGDTLAAEAQGQRARVYVDTARRGEILDRNGKQLAFTMQARSLTASPTRLREELRYTAEMEMRESGEWNQVSDDAREARVTELVGEYLERYAKEIPEIIKKSAASESDLDEKEILKKLQNDSAYEVLVRNVDPDVAQIIARDYHGIAADMQLVRQYPNGAIGENIIGKISHDGQGQFGFEASQDNILAGIDGRKTLDISADGQVIPGTTRDQVAAVDGANVKLTVDLDLQTYLQQQIEQAVANSGAQGAEGLVLDVTTGHVLAMANSDTIDPMGDIERQLEQGKEFTNTSISSPFEPGSVAKVITAAGVIEDKKTDPNEVHMVPGSIHLAGVTVSDAWPHGEVPFTTTGIFGKSSNVGTLMLAQRLGEDRFADLLDKFGIGQMTGIELPGESPGLLLDRSQWSGGTFANLPIGQGMSLTLLQMAGVYQTLANGGVRIEPRIISEVTDAQGNVIEQPEPKQVEVVSKETARTVLDMFRAVVQRDPSGLQQGTGAGAAVEGYQISGKTGTAQQVDPNTGAYSNSNYWITFAGVAPSDAPRYVIALQLDRPQRGVHGEGGQSAAPLFHDIASWLFERDNVPLSPPQEQQLILQPTQ